MAGGNYEFHSDFAKKHQAKGRGEGQAEGRAEGRAKGRAEAILDVLEARGLQVSEEARARILPCNDDAQLATWLRKAATAISIRPHAAGFDQTDADAPSSARALDGHAARAAATPD